MNYVLEAIGTLTRPIMRWVLTDMAQNGFEIDYTGSKNGISVTKRAGAANQSSSCINLTSQNKHFSAMQVRGRELAHGTIKVSHEYQNESDGNASGISIHLEGANSEAKSMFVKHDGAVGMSHQEVFNAASTPVEGFGWSKDATELYMRAVNGQRVKLQVDALGILQVTLL